MADFTDPSYAALQRLPDDVATVLRNYAESDARIVGRLAVSVNATAKENTAAYQAQASDRAALKRSTLANLQNVQETRDRNLGLVEGAIRTAMLRPPAPDAQTALLREMRERAAWERVKPLIDKAGQSLEQSGGGTSTLLRGIDAASGMGAGVDQYLSDAIATGDQDTVDAIVREAILHARAVLGDAAERHVRDVIQQRLGASRPVAAAAFAAATDIQTNMTRVNRSIYSAMSAVEAGSPMALIYHWNGDDETVILLAGADVSFGWSNRRRYTAPDQTVV